MVSIEITLFIVGMIFLIKGADYLVRGASALADKLGVPTLVIGLTIVAFGTSLPELVVNVFSASRGATDVAFGNIVGSNISNFLLILGIIATIIPLKVHRSTIWKELPFALLAVAVLFVVANDFIIDKIEIFSLTRTDGLVMMLFFAVFIFYIIESTRRNRVHLEEGKVKVKKMNYYKISFYIISGSLGLFYGGKWVVEGAITVAQFLGVSDFLISATIIAIGTSLPELVTSIMAALKKDVDLIVGNLVGSNIFNVFWILGVTSIISPIQIPSFVNLDLIFLILITFLIFLFISVGKRHEIDRWQGAALVILYIIYITFIILRG